MKPSLISRLDLLAAASERHWLEDISRSVASLRDAARSREVLGVYRARLAQSWADGSVGPAAQAQRAAIFSGASRAADAQIDQLEARAGQQWQAASLQLAEIRARRAQLRAQRRAAASQAEAEAERRFERDHPANGKPSPLTRTGP